MSRMKALEAENSKLKKDLIVTMDEANTIKEKAKTLSDDLRAEQQLLLIRTSNFWLPRRNSRPLLRRPLRLSSKLRSTTQCSSVGITKVLSF